jgi:hypothetical protein
MGRYYQVNFCSTFEADREIGVDFHPPQGYPATEANLGCLSSLEALPDPHGCRPVGRRLGCSGAGNPSGNATL